MYVMKKVVTSVSLDNDIKNYFDERPHVNVSALVNDLLKQWIEDQK